MTPPSAAFTGPGRHAVRLFDEADYPAGDIAAYLHEGMSQGAAALVFASRPHLDAIAARLGELGFDAAAASPDGCLMMHDAGAVLAATMVDDEPSRPVFDRIVGDAIAAGLSRCRRVRAYGELVDLLCRGGDPEAAARLEQWWTELLAGRPAELLCGYALESFADAGSVPVFDRVCAIHDQVVPIGADAAGDAHLLAELQQSRAALQHEARGREHAEAQLGQLREVEQTARMRALQAADQLGRLQRITASLAEAVSIGEIAAIVCGDLAAVSGAIGAVLAVPVDGGEWLQLLGRDGARIPAARVEVLDLQSALPLAEAFRDRRPLWLPASGQPAGEPRTLACLPLLLRGRVLGALELVFRGRYEPTASERGLLEDQVRQVAIAVDRARTYEAAERARDEAHQERLRAESASRAKDEFLAMLGHELRNPLAPIVTALQLMKLRGDVSSSKEQTIIERQVQHLVRLVDDLLDVSRITRGKVELRRREIDLADVIGRAVEMASPLLEQQQHHLTVSVPRIGMRLLGDEDRLTQVIANLLSNAAKYTPHRGHIDLTAEREEDAIVVRVKDTGIGIPAELLQSIFEPFVQGPRTSDRAEGGLGLGLMLVRSLVQMHGGAVTAFSDGPGAGSELMVRLPALPVTYEPSEPTIAVPPRAISAAHRILVVDDNDDAAGTLADVLRDAGHQVEVAHDGPEALVRARDFRPDVAVLDIGLPVMDGYELAERLNADHPGLWMVAVTGYGRDHDRQRSHEAGFALHLVKPVDLERLLASVEPRAGGRATTAH